MNYYDSRHFEIKRYRALYFLLPVTNGALFVAGYLLMHGYLGIPEISIAPQPTLADILVHFVSVSLLTLMEIGIAAMIIGSFDLFVLRRVYGLNFVPFVHRRLRSPHPDNEPRIPLIGPMTLAALGTFGVLILARTFLYLPDLSGSLVFATIPFVVGTAFAFLYIPALVHGEETLRAEE